MSEEKAIFTEIGRVAITDKKSIVVSSVERDGVFAGININGFISTERYTGYSKGVFIPADKVAEFVQLINKKAE
jgi:hypothetical protein